MSVSISCASVSSSDKKSTAASTVSACWYRQGGTCVGGAAPPTEGKFDSINRCAATSVNGAVASVASASIYTEYVHT